jgi:hypothetical protein
MFNGMRKMSNFPHSTRFGLKSKKFPLKGLILGNSIVGEKIHGIFFSFRSILAIGTE